MLTTLDVLRAARALIATPDRWTRGAIATCADGTPCEPLDARAACWCAMGALEAAIGPGRNVDRQTAMDAAHSMLSRALRTIDPSVGVAVYNDAFASHADILALFDLAIARADHR